MDGTKVRKTPVNSKVETPATMHPDGMGFDIVATIGQVRFGNGPESANVAAMRIIAEHNREGTYRFPHEDGGEWVINMEHVGGPREENVPTPEY